MGRPAGMPKPTHTVESIRASQGLKHYGSGKWITITSPPQLTEMEARLSLQYDEDWYCTCRLNADIGDQWLNDWGAYKDLLPVGEPNPYGMATYHFTCMKPALLVLHMVLTQCDNCEEYYVPEPKRGNFPVKWPLCKKCSGNSPGPKVLDAPGTKRVVKRTARIIND